MKKRFLILFLLALAVNGVFAQNNTVVVDIRRELHAYIDAIPQESLYALRPLLMMLADSSRNNDELHDLLDAIPDRNIEAVRTLLLALAEPSYSAAPGINLPQGTAAAAGSSSAARADAPADTNVSSVDNGFLSFGGGAFFDLSLKKNSVEVASTNSIFYDPMSVGVFAFFDAKYVEISVGPSLGIANYEKLGGETPESKNLKLIQLDLSALGKFPINLADGKFVFFPLLGLSYNAVLSEINGAKRFDLNQVGLLGGVGLDYFITGSLYLRSEGLFHFRLPIWEYMNMNNIRDPNVHFKYGMGLRFKLGIGYRF